MNFKKKVFIISVFNIGSTLSAAASRNLITRSSVRHIASVAHPQQSKPNLSAYYTFEPWTNPLVNEWLFKRSLHRYYTSERITLTYSENDNNVTPSNVCLVMRVPRTAWLHCKNIMDEQRHKTLSAFIKTRIDQAHGIGAFLGATIGGLYGLTLDTFKYDFLHNVCEAVIASGAGICIGIPVSAASISFYARAKIHTSKTSSDVHLLPQQPRDPYEANMRITGLMILLKQQASIRSIFTSVDQLHPLAFKVIKSQ